MPIVEPVIRPPSEAESFLLQITTGCSSRTCTFCGAYPGKDFSIKKEAEIFSDISTEAAFSRGTRKVFLLDGDALAVPNDRLIPVLKRIGDELPKVTRISSYANGYNITQRNTAELEELAGHKLKLIYMGLESGSQKILDICKKRSKVDEMVAAVGKARESGIKSSVIVLLGLGGRGLKEKHVRDTAEALNRMQPKFLSFLSLMLIPGTPLAEDRNRGRFEELDKGELIEQAYQILLLLDLCNTIFLSNHASNYLPLTGRLPQDKDKLLLLLQRAREGEIGLRPEYMRGL